MNTEELKIRTGLGRRLRRYFLTGLVVLAPVGLTIYVLLETLLRDTIA